MKSTELQVVATSILRKMGGRAKLDAAFCKLIRQALDEVIDFPRTGRRSIAELEKTEKTYIGTKVEILTRAILGVQKGKKLDLLVNGIEVDAKFSISDKWMIPLEALNEICLVIYGNEHKGTYGVGLLRMSLKNLTTSKNRDLKRGVSAAGRKNMLWLAQGKLPVSVFEA